MLLSLSQLDKSVITAIATGDPNARNMSLIKIWCKKKVNTVRIQARMLNGRSYRVGGGGVELFHQAVLVMRTMRPGRVKLHISEILGFGIG